MDKALAISELRFKAVRSGGAGGQHVNKVSTKVELTFDIANSDALSSEEKEQVYRRLANKLTKVNILLLQCDESRSQHKNKDLAIKRFIERMESALKVKKKRRKTKPSRSSIEKRLKAKKKNAMKKVNRGRPEF